MDLSLGDVKNDPERALSIKIEVKKATTVEAIRSMKKMSTMGYDKLERSSTQSQSQFAPSRPSNQPGTSLQSQSQLPSTQEGTTMQPPSRKSFKMGNIGQTLDRMLVAEGLAASNEPTADAVSSTTRQYYRSFDAPTGPAQGEPEDEEDEEEESRTREKEVRISEAPLHDAFYYGGDMVLLSDVTGTIGLGGMGGNETGMQIVSFIKKVNVSLLSSQIVETVLTIPLDSIRMEDGRCPLRLCLVRVHRIATRLLRSPQRDGRAQLGRYRAIHPQGNEGQWCVSYPRPSNGNALSQDRERTRVCSLLSCKSSHLLPLLGLELIRDAAAVRGRRA